MTVVDRSALVGHSAQKMYALVADVESYPQFLPWCDRAVVSVNEPGRTVATLHINFRGLKKEFTTENFNRADARIGYQLLMKSELEAAAATRKRLSLFVVGVLRIQGSVTPELADATIERIRIFGAVRGPAAVLERIEDRIIRGGENLEH